MISKLINLYTLSIKFPFYSRVKLASVCARLSFVIVSRAEPSRENSRHSFCESQNAAVLDATLHFTARRCSPVTDIRIDKLERFNRLDFLYKGKSFHSTKHTGARMRDLYVIRSCMFSSRKLPVRVTAIALCSVCFKFNFSYIPTKKIWNF